MYVDGYKIINICQPPSTRLQISDLPVFPHPSLYAGDFNSPHNEWSHNNNSADGDCLATWANFNNLALLNPKATDSFHSDRWNTGINPDLAFFIIGHDSRLSHRRVLEKFPRSLHLGLPFLSLRGPLSAGTFEKQTGATTFP